MTVRVDPEQNEIGALLDFVNLDGRRVLEIGSGNGRLTWHYADRAAHVTAVEPFAPAVAHAEDNLPPELVRRVVLRRAAFGEFAAETASSTFDVAIFSWSLCCMEQSDMVPALGEAHRLLGRDGTVIDIHPVPGTAEIEVHRAGQVVFAEPASTSDGEGERHADEALATVVARGLFVAERRSEFDVRVYASSLRELREFLAEADAHARQEGTETSDASESALYGQVERMMATGATRTEVAYHERARITQLSPSSPDSTSRSPRTGRGLPTGPTEERDRRATFVALRLRRCRSRGMPGMESGITPCSQPPPSHSGIKPYRAGTPKRGGWNGEP